MQGLCGPDGAKVWSVKDFKMQSPTVMEAEDEVLQVLEVCEAIEEVKELIVTNLEEDCQTNSPPVASSAPGSKLSQVRERGSSS